MRAEGEEEQAKRRPGLARYPWLTRHLAWIRHRRTRGSPERLLLLDRLQVAQQVIHAQLRDILIGTHGTEDRPPDGHIAKAVRGRGRPAAKQLANRAHRELAAVGLRKLRQIRGAGFER